MIAGLEGCPAGAAAASVRLFDCAEVFSGEGVTAAALYKAGGGGFVVLAQ